MFEQNESYEIKRRQQAEIDEKIKEFIENGGKITEVPPESKEDIEDKF
jgi:hypothetical protein